MMTRTTIDLTLALGFTCILALPTLACAQEDPEHPEETAEEHSEAAPAAGLTIDELADAIAAYVEDRADEDGYMVVHDPVTEEDLDLRLHEVHRERLSKVAPDTYFACADFVSRDGVTYDLDVFMKGTDAEALEFHDLSVHKVEGEPRYTWYEEDGTWKKRPVGEAGEEHPEGEHPEEHEEHEEHPDDEEHPD